MLKGPGCRQMPVTGALIKMSNSIYLYLPFLSYHWEKLRSNRTLRQKSLYYSPSVKAAVSFSFIYRIYSVPQARQQMPGSGGSVFKDSYTPSMIHPLPGQLPGLRGWPTQQGTGPGAHRRQQRHGLWRFYSPRHWPGCCCVRQWLF